MQNSKVQESIFLKNLSGIRTERTPLWFMRQAGRYLPEYRALRAKHSMLECIMDPQLAKQITLQPFERFDLSAGIIFADILTPLQELGFKVDFKESVGPQLFPALTYENLGSFAGKAITEKITGLKTGIAPYTLEAISITATDLNQKGIPLIGFSGTPFTLACYLIEGKPTRNLLKIKRWILENPAAYSTLIETLTELVANYIEQQVAAGASAIQLFDSWGGYLNPTFYRQFNLPWLKAICSRFKGKCPSVPLIYYSSCTESYYKEIVRIGYDCLSVDWRVDLDCLYLSSHQIVQGNLDPALLIAPSKAIEQEVSAILAKAQRFRGFVFNVGHGVTPETDIVVLQKIIELVNKRG